MASKKSTAKKAAKTAKDTAKKHPKLVIALVIILVIIIVAIAVFYYLKPEVFHKYLGTGEHTWSEWCVDDFPTCSEEGHRFHTCDICGEVEEDTLPANGHNFNEDGICTVCGDSIASEAEIAEADFSIHFLELGNKYAGDCVLIDCGDTEVLIDAGSRQDSAKTLKAYIDQYCDDGKLEYVITTHGDQDHIAAYYGSMDKGERTGILYQYEVGTLIRFAYSNKTTAIFNNYMNRVNELQEQGTQVYTADQCYDERDGAKRQYYLDEEQTLSINILYNYYYYNLDKSDENNHSVVTLLTKETENGNKHYLFTGDLEKEGEEKLVEHYKTPSNSKSEYDILPEVELYKAGHHGSRTSSNEVFIDMIKPKNVVVCACAGAPEYTVNNQNTFPTQDMIDHVGKYTQNIYVTTLATELPELNDKNQFVEEKWGFTSMNGNVVFYYKNNNLKLYCSNNDIILKETDWFKKYRTWRYA